MKRIEAFGVITTWAILLGCGSVRPKIEIGGYEFVYQGVIYRIESVAPNFAEGYNILLLKDEDRIVLKAIDREQDGVLDKVDIGDLTLEAARDIYLEGLAAGERLGKIKKKTIKRDFRTAMDRSDITLVTYILALGEIYNKLIVMDYQYNESVIIDRDADGIIDKIEKGDDSKANYQRLYNRVLNQGQKVGKIERIEGRYIVVVQ